LARPFSFKPQPTHGRKKWQVLQALLEVRFPKAHRYWDDCGKTIEEIETAIPGLTCAKLDGDGFHFVGSSESPLSNGKFYWDKAWCASDRVTPNGGYPDGFNSAALTFLSTVFSSLRVESTTRVGHRIIEQLPFSREQEVTEFWRQNTLLKMNPEAEEAWGVVRSEDATVTIELKDEKRLVTLRIVKAKSNVDQYSAILDFDFTLTQNPEIAELDLMGFVASNRADYEAHRPKLFGAG
jgi:hypothetical protein